MPNDEELNRLVATEVMGWVPYAEESDLNHDGNLFDKGDGGLPINLANWSPLTEIRDAMEVMDRFPHVIATYDAHAVGKSDEKSWYCTIYGLTPEGEYVEYDAGSESLSRAICIAALRAMGVNIA